MIPRQKNLIFRYTLVSLVILSVIIFESAMMTSSNGSFFRVTGHLLRGIHRSPVNSPHKGQWRGALMFFSLICTWTNIRVNNRDAGDLICHRVHYDVTVMHQRSKASRTISNFINTYFATQPRTNQILLHWYCSSHTIVPDGNQALMMHIILLCIVHCKWKWSFMINTETEIVISIKISMTKISMSGCTKSCHNGKCRCSQWRKFRQKNPISVSIMIHKFRTKFYWWCCRLLVC